MTILPIDFMPEYCVFLFYNILNCKFTKKMAGSHNNEQ